MASSALVTASLTRTPTATNSQEPISFQILQFDLHQIHILLIQSSYNHFNFFFNSCLRVLLALEISSSHTRFIDGPREEYPSLQPAEDGYKKLFMEEDGDCYNIRKMSEAALIFDPIEFSKLSYAVIATVNRYRADQVDFFRYRHFTDKFMKALKKEMPARDQEAKRDHDLGRIPASKEYKTRLQERIRRNKPETVKR